MTKTKITKITNSWGNEPPQNEVNIHETWGKFTQTEKDNFMHLLVLHNKPEVVKRFMKQMEELSC